VNSRTLPQKTPKGMRSNETIRLQVLSGTLPFRVSPTLWTKVTLTKHTSGSSRLLPDWSGSRLASHLSTAAGKRMPLPFLARSTRPSLWASCRLEPPWDEIWMRTFASGRSNDVSPTYRIKQLWVWKVFIYETKRDQKKKKNNQLGPEFKLHDFCVLGVDPRPWAC
jgi:hypothetical protein